LGHPRENTGGSPVPRKKKAEPAPTRSPLPHQVGILVGGRIKYVAKPGYVPPVEACPQPGRREKPPAKPKRQPREKAPAARIDPKYLAAARELRDRYLEHVNSDEGMAALATRRGKYDPSRALPPGRETAPAVRMLPRAA
jgi:hypothetical protein